MNQTPETRESIIKPVRHLFLSPHYDDIALSCGGTAAYVAEEGRYSEVALIFGDRPDPSAPMTPFAQEMHTKWGLSAAEVIEGRRAEEASAAAILGTKTTFLPFRDAIYRGDRYLGDPQLFGTPHREEAGLPQQIVDATGLGAVPARDDVRVYAPLAIGNHVDHQHAYRAGQLLAARGWSVWFYEDLPYGLKSGMAAERLARVEREISGSVLVDVNSTWVQKLEAILSYPSQLGVIFSEYVDVGTSRGQIDGAMAAYARTQGDGTFLAERFWLPASTAS